MNYIKKVILNRKRIDSFDQYPFCLSAVRNLDAIDFDGKVTFFVGENASGKSTLLEAIAVKYGFNAEGSSKNFNFHTKATHSRLHEYISLSKGTKLPKDGYFFRAESFYNVATQIDALDASGSYGGTSLHELSHGESFLTLIKERFFGNGLYILDEPEAALSPSRQLSLLVRLRELEKQNSQFIIATHSPILMAYPGAAIYLIDENGIARTSYKDTEHYIITKQFLDSPETMIEYLFEE